MFACPDMLWMLKTNDQKLIFLFLSINISVVFLLRRKLAIDTDCLLNCDELEELIIPLEEEDIFIDNNNIYTNKALTIVYLRLPKSVEYINGKKTENYDVDSSLSFESVDNNTFYFCEVACPL